MDLVNFKIRFFRHQCAFTEINTIQELLRTEQALVERKLFSRIASDESRILSKGMPPKKNLYAIR